MSLAGKVAVVTGASSGLGWALALELAGERCRVGLLARRRERLETLAEQIRQQGGQAALAVADVGDRGQTLAAIAGLRSALGPIDLLIANSGVGQPTPLVPQDVPTVEQMFRVNTLGMIYAFEAVLPEMVERGSGHLAAVSSLAAYLGFPGESGYCASKAAVNVYLEGLRVQLRSRGIAVTTICPGFVNTPMIKHETNSKPWLLEPDRAACLIVRALKRRRKVYNFPWQTALLMKVARWLPDWMLERLFLGQTYQPK